MEIFLLILGIALMALSLYLCVRPHVPAVVAAYGGLWVMQWSGMLEFPSRMMSYWGIMAVVVIIILSMLPQPLVKTTRGMTHITVASLCGMLIGASMGYAPMIVGAFVGAFVGCMVYSKTPSGAALRFPSSKFIQYFCAKGLPAVVTISIIGIAIAVSAVQYR